ncbi:MAG: hypothetical protein KGL39_04695 [Patescibacteria group bacterium]|nr:hypothetical protein [Patescibacteria group bacterium]
MAEAADLFPTAPRFRKPRQHLMHVIDAGNGCGGEDVTWVRVKCRNCDHEEERMGDTVTALKRGIPCPECNGPRPTDSTDGGKK